MYIRTIKCNVFGCEIFNVMCKLDLLYITLYYNNDLYYV